MSNCWLSSGLQSWSKVMVHLAFFDNFTIPSPLPPPPPHTILGQCAQSVPLEATLYGREGGGPSLGKRVAFIIKQGAIMKTLQIFKVYHILLTRIVVQNSSMEAKLKCRLPEGQAGIFIFVKPHTCHQLATGVDPLSYLEDGMCSLPLDRGEFKILFPNQ